MLAQETPRTGGRRKGGGLQQQQQQKKQEQQERRRSQKAHRPMASRPKRKPNQHCMGRNSPGLVQPAATHVPAWPSSVSLGEPGLESVMLSAVGWIRLHSPLAVSRSQRGRSHWPTPS